MRIWIHLNVYIMNCMSSPTITIYLLHTGVQVTIYSSSYLLLLYMYMPKWRKLILLFWVLISTFFPPKLASCCLPFLPIIYKSVNNGSLTSHWHPHKIKKLSRFFSLRHCGQSVQPILLSSLLCNTITSVSNMRTLFTDVSTAAAQVCINHCMDMSCTLRAMIATR